MKKFTTALIALTVFLAVFAEEPIFVNGKHNMTVEKSFSVNPATKLIVSNKNGSVKIEEWANETVLVTAVKTSKKKEKLDQVDIIMENASNLEIEVNYKDKSVNDVSVELKIMIPRGMKIGDIETSNGSIKVSGGSGSPDLSSSNGSIIVKDFQGKVEAHTSNGGIDLRNVSIIEDASTSNGNITVELLSLESSMDLHTSNGTIYIHLGKEFSGKFELSTSNGKIHYSDIDVNIQEASKNYLRCTVLNGGSTVNAKTSNGSIYLKKK